MSKYRIVKTEKVLKNGNTGGIIYNVQKKYFLKWKTIYFIIFSIITPFDDYAECNFYNYDMALRFYHFIKENEFRSKILKNWDIYLLNK